MLHGRVKLRIRKERSHAMPTEHDMVLFEREFEVFSGSFKAELNEEYKFPFTAKFPYTEGTGVEALPPTLSHHFSDAPDIVDLAVQYHLGVRVAMPGIDIQTIVPLCDAQSPIKYELPRPPMALIESNRTTFKQRAKIQNQYLLPEDQQPQGFKQKAKAIFSSSHFPTFVLDIFCTDQQYIYPGQKLEF